MTQAEPVHPRSDNPTTREHHYHPPNEPPEPGAFSPTGDLHEIMSNVRQGAMALAHATRNPLSAIKGAVYYLKNKYGEDPNISEFLEIASHEILRIEETISEFLTIYTENPAIKENDINSLMKKLMVLTSYQMQSHHIETLSTYGDIPLAVFNPFEIGQAILNVLNNSIEAMKTGGKLTVTTRLENYFHTSYIIIIISDTGPGIPENVIKYATREKASRGFGLAITRDILKKHGGHLSITSSNGTGTTVTLHLPYIRRKPRNDLQGNHRANPDRR